jgi:hypothetical protein
MWTPENQAIIVALKVVDDAATLHVCHGRRLDDAGDIGESLGIFFGDWCNTSRNLGTPFSGGSSAEISRHTVCSPFILSISAITGMTVTFLCPWTALSHYEAMKPRDSDLLSLDR